jgi:transposase-like protein
MKNRKYTIEFKKQAVDLAESLGSTIEAGRQLGVADVNIHKWKKLYGKGPTAKQTEALEIQDEMKALKRENVELKKVNHILKAAAAFFSQDHLK